MKKIVNYIKTNKVKSLIGLGVILSLLVVVISISFAEPTPNYSFTYKSNNYDNNEGGSFSLTKTAKWIGHNKLKVTLTVNSKPVISSTNNDILLVVDTSSFLDNDMLNDLKTSLTSSASVINTTDSTSKIGIISFSNSYTKYDFTNDLSTINSNISNLSIGGGRSYYQAFSGIDDILTNRDTSRGLRVIFITTGLSNINKSGDLYKYEQLQDKYNLDVNCIYYLTNKVLTQPNNYFSREIVSNKNSIEVNIESLSLDYRVYDTFNITDHYDTNYFSLVGNLSEYNNSTQYSNYGKLAVSEAGTIRLVIDDTDTRPYYTGTTAKLEYELNYTGGSGNYNLNSNNISVSKTINQTTDNFTITDSLVVGNSYNVTYIANAPSGCTPSGIPSSSHKDVYETVTYQSDPTCSGYKFNGWIVTTEGVKASKNGFIMPEKNVEVKATWSKVSIVKSMSGNVKRAPTLYNFFVDEAEKPDGLVKEYDTFFAGQGYSHQDAYDGSGDKKIYFFRAESSDQANTILDMNNVIFANHCWQMLRTTDTGGVKMIYNGEVEDNKCLSTRSTHVGYGFVTKITITSGAIFGDDYIFDSTVNKFKLNKSKDIYYDKVWSTDYTNLIGKYTCNLTDVDESCSNIYLIEGYNSTTAANVIPLSVTSHFSQFGEVEFNYWPDYPSNLYYSVADVGYMYNKRYDDAEASIGSYYFGSSYTYNESTKMYSLSGSMTVVSANTDFSRMHYTCFSKSLNGTCSSIAYVYFHYPGNNKVYYIRLSDNKPLSLYLDEMLSKVDGNQKNSTIKLAIDKWYEHFISSSDSSKLEDVVFCNNRSIHNLGGWNPNPVLLAGETTQNAYLLFKSTISNFSDLTCENLTDRFSLANDLAKLKYPIGLLSCSEVNMLRSYLVRTSQEYWTLSPYSIISKQGQSAYVNVVLSGGAINISGTRAAKGVRPVISLKSSVVFKSGDGSMSNPYRVD